MIVPIGTVFWSDEHPDGIPSFGSDSGDTIIRLLLVRTKLWRTGVIAEEDLEFWREAQEALPDWPGFERLDLSALNLYRDKRAEEDADSFFVDLVAESEAFWADLHEDGTIEWRAEIKRPDKQAGEADSGA
jgi:hypothetical protein